MNQLQSELLKLLLPGKQKQEIIIQRLDEFITNHGLLNVKKWRNLSNKKNTFLHELVDRDLPDVIRYVVTDFKFDVNIKRESDDLTPYQLALHYQDNVMCDLLKELGANTTEVVNVSQWASEAEREKSTNIVWLDLEMTCFENPEILECAVIITDKDLKELDRKQWVIHYNQSVLDGLAEWHQNTFADTDAGGNGLFKDVLKSRFTNDQVERELLSLLKDYCAEKKCPLAGSSIHIDKEVLKLRMSKVHDYLHYRIIDVSSFQGIMKRWVPQMEREIKKQLGNSGQETVNHRAMDDIEYSIAFMKHFRPYMERANNANNRNNAQFMQHQQHDQPGHRRQNEQQKPHRQNEQPIYNRQNEQQKPHRQNDQPMYNRQNEQQKPHRQSDQPMYNRQNDPPIYNRQRSNGSSSIVRNVQQNGTNRAGDNRSQLYADEKRLLERIDDDKTFDVESLSLDRQNQEIYDTNPHLREVFMNNQPLTIYKKEFNEQNRFLKLSSKRCDSSNYSSEKFSTMEHWGQRKLLLTEIEFLTNYAANNRYLVVYAAAAPGTHINYLSKLFPQLKFDLIDTNDFSITPAKEIQTKPEKFSSMLAKHYGDSKKNILFICNVRTFNTVNTLDVNLINDMHDQMGWHRLMKPRASLLNFRLPRVPGKTTYLKGNLVIEPWASKRSTECRLIVGQDCETAVYDHSEFENSLLHFQYTKRNRYYKYDMDEDQTEGLDHCYDCRAEIFILQEYLTKIRSVTDEIELKTQTANMSRHISTEIVDKKRESCIGVTRTLSVIPKKRTSGFSNQ